MKESKTIIRNAALSTLSLVVKKFSNDMIALDSTKSNAKEFAPGILTSIILGSILQKYRDLGEARNPEVKQDLDSYLSEVKKLDEAIVNALTDVGIFKDMDFSKVSEFGIKLKDLLSDKAPGLIDTPDLLYVGSMVFQDELDVENIPNNVLNYLKTPSQSLELESSDVIEELMKLDADRFGQEYIPPEERDAQEELLEQMKHLQPSPHKN